MQLVEFFLILTAQNIISKNQLLKINKTLRDLENISLKKAKTIKKWMKEN